MPRPSKLSWTKRVTAIAKHIGAAKVIYQELDDLRESCKNAVITPSKLREGQTFEVGVFNGKRVTPPPPGCFQHLEQDRGEKKKMKVMASAREAVANGSAGAEEIQMATNGVEVKIDGKVVPAQAQTDDDLLPLVNGNGVKHGENKKRKFSGHEDDHSSKNRIDIGLHDRADFDHAES